MDHLAFPAVIAATSTTFVIKPYSVAAAKALVVAFIFAYQDHF